MSDAIKEWSTVPGGAQRDAYPRTMYWKMECDGSEWMAVVSLIELRVFKKDGDRWKRVDSAEQGQPL